MYYKVVTADLKSLGLRRNPTIFTYKVGRWVNEPNPTKDAGGWGGTGGIWTTKTRSNAVRLMKYAESKSIKCKLFEVEIGDVLFANSYRTKTNKVKLLKEISYEST